MNDRNEEREKKKGRQGEMEYGRFVSNVGGGRGRDGLLNFCFGVGLGRDTCLLVRLFIGASTDAPTYMTLWYSHDAVTERKRTAS